MFSSVEFRDSQLRHNTYISDINIAWSSGPPKTSPISPATLDSILSLQLLLLLPHPTFCSVLCLLVGMYGGGV